MILALEIIAIVTMCILTGVSVLSFILFKQLVNQLKYKNYLLEKLNLHVYNLSKRFNLNDDTKDLSFKNDDFKI